MSHKQWQEMRRFIDLLKCEMKPAPRNVLCHHLKLAVRWWGRLPPRQRPRSAIGGRCGGGGPGGGALPGGDDGGGRPCDACAGGSGDGVDGCGWLYLGSANHSPSAWGRPLQRSVRPRLGSDAGLKDDCLQIFNFEFGVLFVQPPPEREEERGAGGGGGGGGGSPAMVMCPLPWKGPAPYGKQDLPATTTYRKQARRGGGGGFFSLWPRSKDLQLSYADCDRNFVNRNRAYGGFLYRPL